MQRPPDLAERVARIEERMATREDLAELRALIERRRRPLLGWLGRTASAAAIALGFLALLLVFTG